MKQKYIYIVSQGIVDSMNPLSGNAWIDEVKRFTSLKEAVKFYNSIKKETDWSAPWSLTEIQKVIFKDIEAYDNGDLVDTILLKQHFQPQRGNNEEAFECK